ncbi:hypothetical protein BRADI_4g30892v3 [Brachypodium distachyon]|uniref:Transcription initiation factor TFIID subunit 10 n=1 Tax=Brachypodium distachyon TaxID=15368 RepID=A0A2K2CRK2_BRADI|nr:hypothetical protein BRADI_4g30892v3 [Brachypodium distachyon]
MLNGFGPLPLDKPAVVLAWPACRLPLPNPPAASCSSPPSTQPSSHLFPLKNKAATSPSVSTLQAKAARRRTARRMMGLGGNNGGGVGGMAPGMEAGGGDGRHDDDAVLTEFLSSLMDCTPTIPDELVEHYLARSGFHCPDLRLRLVLTMDDLSKALREMERPILWIQFYIFQVSRSSSTFTKMNSALSTARNILSEQSYLT